MEKIRQFSSFVFLPESSYQVSMSAKYFFFFSALPCSKERPFFADLFIRQIDETKSNR
jgi:hypothetical protein